MAVGSNPRPLAGLGLPIVAHPWVPRTAPFRELRPDWRERLNRNLSRPSTGKWEPIDHDVERPVVFLFSGGAVHRMLLPRPALAPPPPSS